MDLRKVIPGQKLRIPVGTWNTLMDAAQDYQRRSMRRGSEQAADNRSTGVVLLRNDSGQDCYRYDVLGLDDQAVIVDPADDEQEFLQRIVLAGVAPAAEHADSFCILQEPVKDGRFGRAMLLGVTQAWVDIRSESDTHAEPAGGTTANLVSASGGIARILWKQSGSGVKLAILRLGGGGGGGSTYPVCSVICQENIPANSLALIVSYNRKADCYLVKKPDADSISLSQLVWIPDAVPANTVGTGMLDFGYAPLLSDDNVKPGDSVGSARDSWKARKGNNGLEVAALISGTLSHVKILSPGSGYSSAPTITHAAAPNDGGAARQATFLVKLAGSTIGSVLVLDSGEDYASAPTLVYSGNAVLEPVIVGQVDSLEITDGGAGYEPGSHPAVTIAASGSTPATGTADVDSTGKVSALHLTARGFGFWTAPGVTIAPPPAGEGTKRTATAKATLA